MQYLYVALGGALGAVLRYLLSGWSYTLLGTGFPWGTLVVNLTGSFLLGFLWRLFQEAAVSPNVRSIILAGGLGAFTTFSTFALESFNLFREGEIELGLANMVISNVLGLTLVFLGIVLGRLVSTVMHY